MNVSTAGSSMGIYNGSTAGATTWVNYPIVSNGTWSVVSPKEKSKDQLEGEDFKRLIMYQGLKILNIQLENDQIIINCKLGKKKFKIRVNGNLSLEDLKGKIMDEILKPPEYTTYTLPQTPITKYPTTTWYDNNAAGGSWKIYPTNTAGGTI